MEKEIITKEMAKKFMEAKGEVRGLSLKADGEFILQEKGKEGLKKLEAEMANLGYPTKYLKIKTMGFYPIGLKTVTLLALKKLFNFSEEEFVRIGAFQSKLSLIIRSFMKYFFSLKVMAKEAPKIWEKYYTVGELEVSELDEEKKYGILILRNFHLHPLHCRILEGFFYNVIKMMVKSPVTQKETKCTFRGDDYHEFLLKW